VFNRYLKSFESLDYSISADYIYISAGTKVRVTTSNGSSYDLNFRDKIRTTKFDSVQITNRSASDENIEIRFGFGDFTPAGEQSAVEVVNEIGIKGQVEVLNGLHVVLKTPSIFQSVDDVTIAVGAKIKIADANANRKELIIQNDSHEMALCRLGGASVSATQGLKLWGGGDSVGAASIMASSDVWAFNASNGVVTLSIVELLE
jgi:hypothetical protein